MRTVHQVDAKAQLLVRVAHPAVAAAAANPASALADYGAAGNIGAADTSDVGEDAGALQAALEGANSSDLEVNSSAP